MEFNYLVEKQRMVNNLGRTSCLCDGTECSKCTLSKWKNGRNLYCSRFEIEHPLEATEIVRKWAEEHPRKTRRDILLEAFPNAKLSDDGYPNCCAQTLGMTTCDATDCARCWDTEVEEKKK